MIFEQRIGTKTLCVKYISLRALQNRSQRGWPLGDSGCCRVGRREDPGVGWKSVCTDYCSFPLALAVPFLSVSVSTLCWTESQWNVLYASFILFNESQILRHYKQHTITGKNLSKIKLWAVYKLYYFFLNFYLKYYRTRTNVDTLQIYTYSNSMCKSNLI